MKSCARSWVLLPPAAVVLVACAGMRAMAPPVSPGSVVSALPLPLARHAIIGFSVDTPQRAATAAREGVTTTILYGGAPAQGSALAKALAAHHITVMDGAISGILFYWECHRTHTVEPPPKSYSYNPYCLTDENPHIKSEAVVLRDVGDLLERDSRRSYVVGYWVLDDWPFWDPGSARNLLRKIHGLMVTETPKRPAICGFGAGLGKPGEVNWDPGTAANYSNGGCDVVGWYNYSPFGRHHPSLGKNLDWSMKALLPAMQRSLAKKGWNIAQTPLYGIGQGWGGSYDKRFYQPGLTRWEMRAQANGFCTFGATYVGWYAWDDSGFESRTHTPNNSAAIAAGIGEGIKACRQIWQR